MREKKATICKKGIKAIMPLLSMLLLMNCSQSGERAGDYPNDTLPLTKHWESAVPHQTIPSGILSLKAKDCGSCHQEIYEEWKMSTHSVALQDPQFQAEMKKDNIYACLNCHIPLQNQQEFIVTGLLDGDHKRPVRIPNPDFDAELQQESITCAACHVRDGKVIGTIGMEGAIHAGVVDTEFLSEKLCISCHNVVDQLNPVLVCTFETGDEWKDNWAIREGKNCISCHMEEKERAIFPGGKIRKSHFHGFPGSGIPKFYDMKTTRLDGLEVTPDSLLATYQQGDTIRYKLRLKNSFAGHNVPTGDPERFFLINFYLTDTRGDTVQTRQYRIGEVWEWHPVAKKVADDNLKPLEERDFIFAHAPTREGKFTLKVAVTKHRITKENADYNGLTEEYPMFTGVYERAYEVEVVN